MKKLIAFKDNIKLAEIFQSMDVKFSFIKKVGKDSYEQIHMPAKCRDFLGDCIWSKLTNKPVSIYSFQYNYKDAPYDNDMLRISLKFPNEISYEAFKSNFDKIVKDKNLDKIGNGVSWYETDTNLTLIVEADKLWQEAIWKLSLFTFYIKVASYPDMTNLGSPENNYASLITKKIEKTFLKKVSEVGKEVIKPDLYDSHNRSGFVSIIKGQDEEMNKIILGEV